MKQKYPEMVFRTQSPEAIAWWREMEALRKEELRLRREFTEEMTELYGPSPRTTGYPPAPQETRELWVRGRGGRAFALDSGYDEKPPADSGWRLDSKDRNWQPALAKKEGKILRDRLDKLNLLDWDREVGKVGIPAMAIAGNYMFSPQIHFDEETQTLYNGWGSQHVMGEVEAARARADREVVWEQMKLSEYIAYLESKEEAEVDDDES